MTTFKEHSKVALEEFLRTAIVVDDNVDADSAMQETSLQSGELIEPGRESSTAVVSREAPAQHVSSALDSKALVDAFFKKGILCTVLERSDMPNMENMLRADILVLDWMLGDDGSKTTEFIKQYIEKHPHVLRMICIYTSERDTSKIFNKLTVELPDINEPVQGKNILQKNNTYIILFHKGTASTSAPQGGALSQSIQEKELPSALIEYFAPLVGGLLRNAVLRSIGAIRNNTHTLISRFPAILDPAFVTHRAYSTPCEDTEQHVVPLICSEISNILLQEKIPNNLNLKAINAWIDDKDMKSCKRRTLNMDGSKLDSINNCIKALIKNGIEYIDSINDISKEVRTGIKKAKESTMTKYCGAKEPQKADATLAILMSCEHIYSDSYPILQAGTLIKQENTENYFLCVQPPCDCVRIEESGRTFLFAPVSVVTSQNKFDFVFIDNSDNVIYFKKDKKIYRMKTIIFSPRSGENSIFAYREDGDIYFKDNENGKFIFILQLKDVHALREIHEYASNLARIGLTESDWLRRCRS